jgi:hypothetical protein
MDKGDRVLPTTLDAVANAEPPLSCQEGMDGFPKGLPAILVMPRTTFALDPGKMEVEEDDEADVAAAM